MVDFDSLQVTAAKPSRGYHQVFTHLSSRLTSEDVLRSFFNFLVGLTNDSIIRLSLISLQIRQRPTCDLTVNQLIKRLEKSALNDVLLHPNKLVGDLMIERSILSKD